MGQTPNGGEAGGGDGVATAPAATAASSPPPPSATALRATSAAFIPRSVTVPNRPRAVPPVPPAPKAKGGASGKQKKATRPKKSGVADRADVSPVDPPADPPPDAVPKNKNKASAKRSTKGTGGRPDNWWRTITQCGKFILITVRAIRLTPCLFLQIQSRWSPSQTWTTRRSNYEHARTPTRPPCRTSSTQPASRSG